MTTYSFRSSGFTRPDGQEDLERCEDGEPGRVFTKRESVALFVTDGLGGYSRGYDGHTGGFWASRIVCDVTRRFLQEYDDRNGSAPCDEFSELLTGAIRTELREAANTKLSGPTRLRGDLAQYHLASTLAGAIVFGERAQMARLFWAGDSRLYWLSTAALHQLSHDDVKVETDAFTALANDSPMSQFLAANMRAEWTIHAIDHPLTPEGLLIACTDGCFAYWPAPWDFELALIDAFRQADDWGAWIERVRAAVDVVKKDDASLAIFPLGGLYSACREQILQDPATERACNRASRQAKGTFDGRKQAWHDIYKEHYERELRAVRSPQPNENLPVVRFAVAGSESSSPIAPLPADPRADTPIVAAIAPDVARTRVAGSEGETEKVVKTSTSVDSASPTSDGLRRALTTATWGPSPPLPRDSAGSRTAVPVSPWATSVPESSNRPVEQEERSILGRVGDAVGDAAKWLVGSGKPEVDASDESAPDDEAKSSPAFKKDNSHRRDR